MERRIENIFFIVFAIVFIAVAAIMTHSINSKNVDAYKTLADIIRVDDALKIYDRHMIYGDNVENCAEKPDCISEGIKKVYVVTKSKSEDDPITADVYDIVNPYNVVNVMGTGSQINKQDLYESFLCYSVNGEPAALLFIQSPLCLEISEKPENVSELIYGFDNY